jgi:sugar/nucleoside kinase (ribokinase family)
MPVLIVGSVALDTIKTADGTAAEVLGGSATYCAYAASFFTPAWLVSRVGEDMPRSHLEDMAGHGVDTAGLQVVPGGKTLRWVGRYSDDFLQRTTDRIDLNVFDEYQPELPDAYREAEYAFLANGAPQAQKAVIEQLPRRKLVFLDTMNLWITESRDALLDVMTMVDGMVLNDEEARLLTGDNNLLTAARSIRRMGPDTVVIKKGEHGAIVVSEHEQFVVPAWLTENVHDPTGAGDCFGGAMMGWLARRGDSSFDAVKTAVSYGTVVASFCIENFSVERLRSLSMEEIENRRCRFAEMVSWK